MRGAVNCDVDGGARFRLPTSRRFDQKRENDD